MADHEATPPDAHLGRPPAIAMQAQQEELREGRIVGFTCRTDGHEQFSPMLRCPRCGGTNITTRQFSRTGRVAGFTIQSVASEQYLNETPFAFVVVQLDDGPRVSGWVPWIARPKDLQVGQAVEYTPSYKPGMMFEKR